MAEDIHYPWNGYIARKYTQECSVTTSSPSDWLLGTLSFQRGKKTFLFLTVGLRTALEKMKGVPGVAPLWGSTEGAHGRASLSGPEGEWSFLCEGWPGVFTALLFSGRKGPIFSGWKRVPSSMTLLLYSPGSFVTQQKSHTYDAEHSDRREDGRCKRTEASCHAQSPGSRPTSTNLTTYSSHCRQGGLDAFPASLLLTFLKVRMAQCTLLLGQKFILFPPPPPPVWTVSARVVPFPGSQSRWERHGDGMRGESKGLRVQRPGWDSVAEKPYLLWKPQPECGQGEGPIQLSRGQPLPFRQLHRILIWKPCCVSSAFTHIVFLFACIVVFYWQLFMAEEDGKENQAVF